MTLHLTPAPAGRAVWGNVRLTNLPAAPAGAGDASLEGQLYGQTTAPQGLSPEVLRAQMQAQQAPLAIARGFLLGKLRSELVLLERLSRQAPTASQQAEIRAALEALPQATLLEALRGLEGNAARAYFSGLQAVLFPYGFSGRNRRPPRRRGQRARENAFAIAPLSYAQPVFRPSWTAQSLSRAKTPCVLRKSGIMLLPSRSGVHLEKQFSLSPSQTSATKNLNARESKLPSAQIPLF